MVTEGTLILSIITASFQPSLCICSTINAHTMAIDCTQHVAEFRDISFQHWLHHTGQAIGSKTLLVIFSFFSLSCSLDFLGGHFQLVPLLCNLYFHSSWALGHAISIYSLWNHLVSSMKLIVELLHPVTLATVSLPHSKRGFNHS